MPKRPQPPETLPLNGDSRAVLAYNMRLLRAQKGWSQERLALECGLDRTYVSAIERSRWNVSLGNIERIAEALGVEAFELLMLPKD